MNEEAISEKKGFLLDKIILIALLVLSVIGVGITDFSPAISHYYWLTMIFVFAVAAMYEGYKQAQEKNLPVKNELITHLIHWTGAVFAVLAVYAFLHTGRIDFEQTGLMILLILALATFLDGIRLGWRFSLAGIFLGLTAILMAYLEEFMIIMFAIAIAIIVIGFFWHKYKS